MSETPVNDLMRRVKVANRFAKAAAREAAEAAGREEYEIASALFVIASRQMMKAHAAHEELEVQAPSL